jgi:HlyD family secretion protein
MRMKTNLHAALCIPVFALTLLAIVGCNSGPEVRTIKPEVGPLDETFTEPGETRLEEKFLMTMPVTGRVGRIDLKPGDAVTSGQVLAEIDLVPFQTEYNEALAAVNELRAEIAVKDDHQLEDTMLIYTENVLTATQEVEKAGEAQVEAQGIRASRSTKELQRLEELKEAQSVSDTRLDDARLDAETGLISLRQEEFNLAATRAINAAAALGPRFISEWLDRKKKERRTLEARLVAQEARLERAAYQLELARLESPIDGTLLEKHEDGGQPMEAGQPLLLIGDLNKMEVIVDVLTQDALRLRPGGEVELLFATSKNPLTGRVERIEPAGFTKLSSLGVEQQRVNVIVTLDERPENLGVGYRLQARFITGRKQDALVLPRFSVLQNAQGGYYVFRVVNGILRETPIELGLRGDLALEVVSGLKESDNVVASPDSSMKDGARVSATK